MAGYQPARGSFEEEYDDQAECILELLNDPTWINQKPSTILESNSVYYQLNETILDIFSERLKERHRRKEIVKDYGLVAFNKHQLWIKSLEVQEIISIFFNRSLTQNKLLIFSDYIGPRNDATFDPLPTHAQTIGF